VYWRADNAGKELIARFGRSAGFRRPSSDRCGQSVNGIGEAGAAADGRFVYASNRGYDSIAVFAREPETGRLNAVACPLSGGKTPRFFAIDPSQRFVYVANEDSDTIRMFRVESDKGTLASTDTVVQVGSPVCMVFS